MASAITYSRASPRRAESETALGARRALLSRTDEALKRQILSRSSPSSLYSSKRTIVMGLR